MPHENSRPVLAGEHPPQPSDVIRQFRQRELWSRHAVTGGLEALDGGAPAGAVRPRAVDEDDVRLISHFDSPLEARGKGVRDAMTEDPHSIGQSASVVEAARLMREEHIGSLPITDDEKLVGMITDRDITTRVVAEAADPAMTSVGDVYSRDLISVEPDEDLDEALQLMARHQVRRLPVVENGSLVGIVAQADIALGANEKKTGELVEAISAPSEGERS